MLAFAHSHHCARSSSARLVATQRNNTTPVATVIPIRTTVRGVDGASAACVSPTVVAPTTTTV